VRLNELFGKRVTLVGPVGRDDNNFNNRSSVWLILQKCQCCCERRNVNANDNWSNASEMTLTYDVWGLMFFFILLLHATT
jgi:hypothetical protein